MAGPIVRLAYYAGNAGLTQHETKLILNGRPFSSVIKDQHRIRMFMDNLNDGIMLTSGSRRDNLPKGAFKTDDALLGRSLSINEFKQMENMLKSEIEIYPALTNLFIIYKRHGKDLGKEVWWTDPETGWKKIANVPHDYKNLKSAALIVEDGFSNNKPVVAMVTYPQHGKSVYAVTDASKATPVENFVPHGCFAKNNGLGFPSTYEIVPYLRELGGKKHKTTMRVPNSSDEGSNYIIRSVNNYVGYVAYDANSDYLFPVAAIGKEDRKIAIAYSPETDRFGGMIELLGVMQKGQWAYLEAPNKA